MQTAAQPIKVFLADDSAQIRERVVGLLSGRRMSVVGEGETPAGCIEGILSSHPDVVVLDVQLDGGTGLQVLRTVREADPQVAFVVFSNNASGAYRRRYLAEGALHFLDKTTEFDRLADVVEATGHAPH